MKRSGLDSTLSALADPTRRGIVDILRRDPQSAGEIAAALEVSAPALSRHLRLLRRCGLVDEQQDGSDYRVRIYSLRREPFAALQDWLEQVEAFWGGQLGSFRKHVARKKRGERQ